MNTTWGATRFAKVIVFYFAVLILVHQSGAQSEPKVIVPDYGDKYSKLATQLEAGQTDINYTEFRSSFLESEQFKAAGRQSSDLVALRKTMHQLMKSSKYPEIVAITKKMLSIDYTDMEAHKILQQSYKFLGDTTNRNKYHEIEFGLLNSIVKKGDGKTCQTAWPVIQITEEYFILEMLGAKLLAQTIDNRGGICDRMEVETAEGKETYYFGISSVMKGYKKNGIE